MRHARLLSKCSLIALFVAASGQAIAEEAKGGLEEIVVTATRRKENLQNVPVPVSAITGDRLKDSGVYSTQDLNATIPNLQVSSPYGSAQPNFSLRGVGVANEYNANAASPIGVYVDEVYQTFRSSHGQQLYDLDRIEVVRGPQGTLYGRNTTGGAINFITRQPSLKSGINGYISAGYGNYNRYATEGAFEATLVPGKLGIRVSGTYSNSDPYIKNVNPKSFDPGGNENLSGRAIIRFKPTDWADITIKAYSGRTAGGNEAPIATGHLPNSDVAGDVTHFLGGAFAPFAPQMVGGFSKSAAGLDDLHINADTNGKSVTRAEGGTVTAKFDLNEQMSIISVSGIDGGRYAQLPRTDCDGTPFNICAIGYDSGFKAFNQDVRFDYHSDRVKLIVGGYYGHDHISTNNRPDFFGFLGYGSIPGGTYNPGGLLSGLIAPTGLTGFQHFDQIRESYAFYGEGSVKITEKLKITLGLRNTHDLAKYRNGTAIFYDANGLAGLSTVNAIGPTFVGPNGLLPPGLGLTGASSNLSGRAILDYQWTPDLMTYVSFSRGYRAGTFNGLAYGSNAQVYFVKPEKLQAIEGGVKSRWFQQRLQVNATVFHYAYKNQQAQEVSPGFPVAFLVNHSGQMIGGELEVQLQATEDLLLTAAYGVIHSDYDNGSRSLTGIDISKTQFPFAPRYSANLGFDWTAYKFDNAAIIWQVDSSYTGKFFYDPNNGRATTGAFQKGEGGYWLVNSRLSYRAESFTVSAWVKNLTDELYYPYGIDLEALFDVGYRVRAAPRTFGGDVTFRF